MSGSGVCWLEGRIQPLETARIPVLDHGLLYGDGVFEGIRFYHGRPLLLAAHLQRLFASARAIALPLPWTLTELSEIVTALIDAYGHAEGYIRLIVTRGDGALGIDPRHCREPRLIVIADALQMVAPEIRERGARLIIASTRRLPPDGLDPRIKSLNYLNHILARLEANQAGADEAVLLNARGCVAEGTADNLFIVQQGSLVTPPVTDGALAGITRQLILDLARDQGVNTEQRSLAPYDLYTADECFLSGTGAELIPVREVDGRPLTACPGPLFRRCAAAFQTFIQQHCGRNPP
ncbi:branched-chain-amino-acid transaminase [Thiohalobacter sp. IOR34]|uniref:branched-chain-amino-acid transaminase n=1 Tax=Thiohalobacter sp. IOR34 TaxID=3057176 RepID=UPI0025B27D23|nr:branched-chain-amino-acid transaminase [Thiohalobacter sp. IOR34]WJW76436.1 branched-chain-amino-acid transaminase [Thiohalobacter sp. IOR34]